MQKSKNREDIIFKHFNRRAMTSLVTKWEMGIPNSATENVT